MESNFLKIKNVFSESIALRNQILSDDSFVESIYKITDACLNSLKIGGKIILAGNGGSAADAQHIAAEFVSRYLYDRPALAAIALSTDTSILTAIGNDYGFERLFERQLEAIGNKGDIFIGITTSGNSSNILRAIDKCKKLNITSIAFTGSSGLNKINCDHILKIPSLSTPRIQELHITIGHIICEIIESTIFPK